MNCYENKVDIKPFDLLVAEDSDFDLTRNRVYVAISDSKYDLVTVVKDKGIEETYATEYFRLYNGEKIGI